MQDLLILIPARLASTRFPGKPLASILGQPMILHVAKRCLETGMDVGVVTDDDEIEKTVRNSGIGVYRVDDDVQSGSERIHLAYERFFKPKKKYSLILNVQGDEPLIEGKLLLELAQFHLKSSFEIATLVHPHDEWTELYKSPHCVKVAYSKNTGECHYFSRAPIPYLRPELKRAPAPWYQHVGVYSYRPSALEKFCQSEQGKTELSEGLEQLRALDLGLKIGALETKKILMGVDTPEDIKRVEGVLRGQ